MLTFSFCLGLKSLYLTALENSVPPAFDTGDFTEPFEMFYDMAYLYDYNTQRSGLEQ